MSRLLSSVIRAPANAYLEELHRGADRFFLWILSALALGSLGMALHQGSWFAFVAVSVPTLVFTAMQVYWRPGRALTRSCVAIAAMVFSAVLIQQGQGLVELHFTIFVLLALLLYYRDLLPILVAAGTIAVHHVVFFQLQAMDIGILAFAAGSGFGIVVLHAAYVVAETVVLCVMAWQLRREVMLYGASPGAVAQASLDLAAGELPRALERSELPVGSAAYAVRQTGQDMHRLLVELDRLLQAQSDGDFSGRISPDGRAGIWLDLVNAVNAGAANLERSFDVVESGLRSIADGELAINEVEDARGRFRNLQAQLHSTTRFLGRFRDEQLSLVGAAVEGRLDGRIDLAGLQGYQHELGAGLNRLLEEIGASVSEVRDVLGALAKGQLHRRVERDFAGTFGEMKRDANQTVDQLRSIVSGIQHSAAVIAGAAAEIGTGNENLSQRTEAQAASLEETASSMEELTSTVHQNAENSRQARSLSVEAAAVAVRGGEVVADVVSTMDAISTSSRKIADIIGVIDGIAFQTNILALNAAVEAARAGEQGRGFAVVASEVRSLAQRSADAAREIKSLISASVSRVEGGTVLVARAGETIGEVVTQVQRMTAIMAEIAAASDEQSTGISQVNQTVAQMDEATQRNAGLVEEVATTAQGLQQAAAELATAAARFELDARRGPVLTAAA